VSKENHVPDWMLERYLLGELPRKKRRQLEKQLERDPALRSELEAMRLSDRQILGTYPPERMIPEILRRAALAKPLPASPRRRRLAWVAVPALALALFLLVILPPLLQRRLDVSESSRTGDYTGTKGGEGAPLQSPSLQIHRRTDGADQILPAGAVARAGDLLQVAYTAHGRTHGVILSIDGGGSVTLHFPLRPDGDTALQGGGRVLLADAFELDAAPRFERFFFITSREPLPTASILEKARELAAGGLAMTGPLDLPAGYGQYSLLLRK